MIPCINDNGMGQPDRCGLCVEPRTMGGCDNLVTGGNRELICNAYYGSPEAVPEMCMISAAGGGGNSCGRGSGLICCAVFTPEYFAPATIGDAESCFPAIIVTDIEEEAVDDMVEDVATLDMDAEAADIVPL